MRAERILFASLLLVSSQIPLTQSAWAAGNDRIPGSRYTSGRGAALGDSFIGLADDVSSSLFYNPAGLGKLSGFALDPLNIQFQANKDLVGQFGTDWYKFTSLSGYKDELTGNPRTFPGGSFGILPAFGVQGFGFGLLYQSSVAATSDGTNIRYRSKYQLIPTAGFGMSLASGVLRVGYSLQWVNQASGDKTVAATSSPLGYNQSLAEGAGFSHNFGMSLTLPYIYQPSFHLVARNIAGLKFSQDSLMSLAKNPSGRPDTQKMSADFAAGFVTKIGAGVNMNHTFTYRDFTDTSKTARLAHLALGLELTFRDVFFIRGGYGSGYPSAGVGFRTELSELNLAWFSEEVGAGLRSERDIRYIFHYIMRAF